jgi:GNAT superfamily N-acetyltransferase
VVPAESRAQLRRFIRFPFDLYRHDRCWVPPFVSQEWRTFDRARNPAYAFCRARLFLAVRDGRVVGRVAAIINERYVEKWQKRNCRFGWLDFVEDPEVSAALLAAVEGWAREQGMSAVHGPLGFTNFDKAGMLVEGFQELGTMETYYNHPYYPAHLEALGYRKEVDWIEFLVQVPAEIPEKVLRLQEIVLKRNHLRLVESRRRKLLERRDGIFHLLNLSYSRLFAVVEMDQRQIREYGEEYLKLIDPDFAKVIVNEQDEVVGFGLAVPSLAVALQRARGRLLPFGFLHVLHAQRSPRRLELLLVAVRPDYQGRGVPAILMSEITRCAILRRVIDAETNPELEENVLVQSIWKDYDKRQHKRRRCYIKSL